MIFFGSYLFPVIFFFCASSCDDFIDLLGFLYHLFLLFVFYIYLRYFLKFSLDADFSHILVVLMLVRYVIMILAWFSDNYTQLSDSSFMIINPF